jgi:Formate hydrogenlyase subunit 6/NADH:ubiquinone oxidoreductase 23 kD subunit (chain I)
MTESKALYICDQSDCVGCGVCADICPRSAIKMDMDDSGFLFPSVDSSCCIGCERCSSVCPPMNAEEDAFCCSKSYITASKQSLNIDTFLKKILQPLSKDWIILAPDLLFNGSGCESLPQIKMSKGKYESYVERNMLGLYKKIKNSLKNGEHIVFIGVPCYVAALKNYIGRYHDELMTISIACEGVTSGKIVSSYLKEVENKEKVSISFSKVTDTRFNEIMIGTKTYPHDLFFEGMVSGILTRDSCSNCKIQNAHSLSDFTISNIDQTLLTSLPIGSSTNEIVVKANSINAIRMLNENQKIKSILIDCENIEMKNGNNCNADKKYRFRESLKRNIYSKALRRSMKDKYDVGLVCIYTIGNFGGALTSFALYKMLMKNGYDVLLIERPLNSKHKPALTKIYENSPFPDHAKADFYPNKEAMHVLNNYCDSFIVGSDQMFHVNLYLNFSEWVTLDWVKDSKKKISFASSFGHDTFTGSEDIRSKMSYFMKKFDKFSVREKSGVKVAKDFFDVDAEWVLDPVFMCDPKDYVDLASQSESMNGHIFAYLLDVTEEKVNVLNHVKDKLGMPHELFSEFSLKPDKFSEFGVELTTGTIERRLTSMINSKIIVTDSFHGLCFAIIFKKPFVVIRNAQRGSTRFDSLMSMLKMEDRLVDSCSDLIRHPELMESPDYGKIHKILDKERARCVNWIVAALNDPKKKSSSEYDVLEEKVAMQSKRINELAEENSKMKSLLVRSLVSLDKDSIKGIDDLPLYLDGLKGLDKGFYIISVKDTPGCLINEEITNKMRELGLMADLRGKILQGYIAVVDHGKILFENLAPQNTPLEYTGTTASGEHITVISKPAKAGNVSEMIINGKNYSQNRRGLNIVLYDSERHKAVDTVTFDTHNKEKGITITRGKIQ